MRIAQLLEHVDRNNRPPWLRRDLLSAPFASPYGYYRKRKAIPAPLDAIQEAIGKDGSERIHMVWTPDSLHVQAISQVEALRAAILLRDKYAYQRGRIFRTFQLTIFFLALLLLPAWLNHWPQWVYVPLVVIGVIPLGLVVWYEKSKPIAEREGYWEKRAVNDRYQFWLQHQVQLSSWAILVALVGVGLVEYSLGLTKSVESAGLVKSAVWQGEVWRLLTGTFLHGSLAHLAFNSMALVWVGKHLEALLPHSYVIIIFLLTAVSGSITSLLLMPSTASIGASGGVMGLLGVLFAYAWRYKNELPQQLIEDLLWDFAFVASYGALNYFAIDNAAHAGGWFTGLLLGGILSYRSAGEVRWRSRSCIPTILALLGLSTAVILTIGFLGLY